MTRFISVVSFTSCVAAIPGGSGVAGSGAVGLGAGGRAGGGPSRLTPDGAEGLGRGEGLFMDRRAAPGRRAAAVGLVLRA